MAFKMKNPSMAKMVKAAGDNRAAMKMKMEEKTAAKMKKESAMKMEKESMAKLMEKSSMKMKKASAMKKEETIEELIKQLRAAGTDVTKREAIMRKIKALMIKEGVEGADKPRIYDKETGEPLSSPTKQKMNMVKGPDGKMVPDFAVDGKGANDMKSGAKMKKASPAKKKDKMKASRTVQLKSRGMYPGDAVFEGSEKSKVDQRITNNFPGGVNKSKTYTHFPEGYGSVKLEEAGKRKKATMADGSTKVTKKRTFGGTKEFAYDAQGNLKSKIKRNRKGEITKAKGDNVFSGKKLRNKGRKTKDFSKKEKAALSNVKTKYVG